VLGRGGLEFDGALLYLKFSLRNAQRIFFVRSNKENVSGQFIKIIFFKGWTLFKFLLK
jgi:hypothetical protein